jgi:hypothetical protein
MSDTLKHSILQTVEQKFRLGEAVIAVSQVFILLLNL